MGKYDGIHAPAYFTASSRTIQLLNLQSRYGTLRVTTEDRLNPEHGPEVVVSLRLLCSHLTIQFLCLLFVLALLSLIFLTHSLVV